MAKSHALEIFPKIVALEWQIHLVHTSILTVSVVCIVLFVWYTVSLCVHERINFFGIVIAQRPWIYVVCDWKIGWKIEFDKLSSDSIE